MGTINYKTSDFITLAIRPYDVADYLKDADFCEFCREEFGAETEEEIMNLATDTISDTYEDDWSNAKSIINRFSFSTFSLTITPGYYEGVQVVIRDLVNYYDNAEEKKDAQKEVTRLKKALEELAGCGFVATCPGWSSSYSDYPGTMEEIRKAAREIRKTVAKKPTAREFFRKAARA